MKHIGLFDTFPPKNSVHSKLAGCIHVLNATPRSTLSLEFTDYDPVNKDESPITCKKASMWSLGPNDKIATCML